MGKIGLHSKALRALYFALAVCCLACPCKKQALTPHVYRVELWSVHSLSMQPEQNQLIIWLYPHTMLICVGYLGRLGGTSYS